MKRHTTLVFEPGDRVVYTGPVEGCSNRAGTVTGSDRWDWYVKWDGDDYNDHVARGDLAPLPGAAGQNGKGTTLEPSDLRKLFGLSQLNECTLHMPANRTRMGCILTATPDIRRSEIIANQWSYHTGGHNIHFIHATYAFLCLAFGDDGDQMRDEERCQAQWNFGDALHGRTEVYDYRAPAALVDVTEWHLQGTTSGIAYVLGLLWAQHAAIDHRHHLPGGIV